METMEMEVYFRDVDNPTAQEEVNYARHLMNNEDNERAFNYFIMAVDRDSGFLYDSQVEDELRTCLKKLSKIHASAQDHKTLFGNFSLALNRFPRSVEMHNDMGKYLYKYRFYKDAMLHFEKVLKLDPFHVTSEMNLNSIKNLLVERWHFRMLNDHIRNEYYRKAIHHTVVPTRDQVIDVGTGTGLLAIYAREVGPEKVIACDASEVMAKMAKHVLRTNRLKKIKIINEMSTALNVTRLGGKCTLLLTELFDAGLFGEQVLQMLAHAWQTYLAPGARIIPNRAEFFVVGVQCEYLNKKYQVSAQAKSLLQVPFMNIHADDDTCCETYDCEDVHMIRDIKYITDSVSVVTVNFNDPSNIQEILEKTTPYNVELKAKESGYIDNIIGWFNLYLSDDVTITTNPLADNRANAWQQTVFFHMIPKPLEQNETLDLKFFTNGGKLRLSSEQGSGISWVSKEIVRFLNDIDHLLMIQCCVDEACRYFDNENHFIERSQITIVDLCPFPYFGIQMLKRGAQHVVCYAKNGQDEQFIMEMCFEHTVSLDNITVIEGEFLDSDIFTQEKYHVIFSHYLELCGDIDQRLRRICLRLQNTHLHHYGLCFPHDISIMGQLVSCHWLDLNNKVYDHNVSKYKIASSINKYQVTQNFFIDFNMLRYVPISDPVEIWKSSLDFDTEHQEKPVAVINNGLANAILCWFKIDVMEFGSDIETNRPNSFMDGMLFLTNSKESFEAGKVVNVARYGDKNGAFKLVIEKSPAELEMARSSDRLYN